MIVPRSVDTATKTAIIDANVSVSGNTIKRVIIALMTATTKTRKAIS